MSNSQHITIISEPQNLQLILIFPFLQKGRLRIGQPLQQQQHSLLSQASWGRLTGQPLGQKKVVAATNFMSTQIICSHSKLNAVSRPI